MYRTTVILLVFLPIVSLAFGVFHPDRPGVGHPSSILDSYKGRHQDAVNSANDLMTKLKSTGKPSYFIGRLQATLQYCLACYNDVLKSGRGQPAFSGDFYVKKYVESLKALENIVSEIHNHTNDNHGNGHRGPNHFI